MNSLSHNAAVKARSEPDIQGGYENLFYGYEIARAAREDGHDVCLVAEEAFLASLHEVFRPFVVNALRYAFSPAQLSNAFFTAQPIQHNADLLFSRVLFTRFTFDVFYNPLAGCLFVCFVSSVSP